MPEIEISEDQRAYLEDLRAELAAEHVGAYGAVRHRDALQFLIDSYEGDVPEVAEEADDGTGEAADDGDGDVSDEDDEASGADGDSGDSDGDDDAAESGAGRLQAMMRLLEDHDGKWEEVDSEQGKYAVTLPDGETETVRTKDDVRGLLFKHYR